ncbi:hypothetical protein M1B72_02695 [Geomonas paludis]|uniref:Uncharacterized protein n=1 Tax=Geomonas paludis TaxID=2740185 RepID=A0A6V8N057_9BACT|nr:hypothetical protein [Geomonas paludis]UPU36632.1 hypothetical protein M1B72_02695 [Geomonas paludis]GFO65895.1 hypothetical protein GMPD_38140 [Geomonas paludis]
MRKAVITTCTGRKKVMPVLHSANLPVGDQASLLNAWVSLVKTAPTKHVAKDIYCGRGFSEALTASAKNDADLWVISAGLGLISGNHQIPSYNLTISTSSPESIQLKVVPRGTFAARRWWRDLNETLYATHTPLADLIRKKKDYLFILSLNYSYAEMVEDDLLSLSSDDLGRLRITGLGQNNSMHDRLKAICMPYDERFDGPNSPGKGTRSDFPQRTARHFIENILINAEADGATRHAAKVAKFLVGKEYPAKVKRNTKTDDEIKEILRARWFDAGGTSARMLRMLRDDMKVACEQKRFSQLFKSVKAEKNGP